LQNTLEYISDSSNIQNTFIPSSIQSISITEIEGFNPCKHFDRFAGTNSSGCQNTGPLSDDFIKEYLAAKSGFSDWLDFEPRSPDAFSLRTIFKGYAVGLYILMNAVTAAM